MIIKQTLGFEHNVAETLAPLVLVEPRLKIPGLNIYFNTNLFDVLSFQLNFGIAVLMVIIDFCLFLLKVVIYVD